MFPLPAVLDGRRLAPTPRALVVLLTAALLAGLLAVPSRPAEATASAPATDDTELASRFTLAVLPDTQFYSRYAADQFQPRYGSNPYAVQTQWLAEHADELNIPFVTHLGDLVDRVGVTGEWQVADAAHQTLEDAGLPYSVLPGNHDVRNSNDQLVDTDYDLANEPFLDWFPTSRAAALPTFGGADPTGLNRWHVFEAQGQGFLVLALAWRSSDATLAWADDVIDAHPDLPVILTSHSILSIQADAESPDETAYGLKLWNDLIRGNDQIFMTLNGHFHGATRLTKTNDFGNPVTQILMDYQMAYDGGNGYLGLMEFDLTAGEVSVLTGSPWVVAKPQEVLTPYDQAILEGPNQAFTFEMDFAGRYDGFDAGPADQPSLIQAARDILLDGFEAPDGVALEQAGSREDFVPVEGTVAHWRFDGEDGPVGEDVVFDDIAGDADLRRVAIEDSGATGAELGDVVLTHDANPFSADGAAICFTNADKQTNRYSYLTSPSDVAATQDHLEEGYTIETFVLIDEDWTADANAWSKVLVRAGNRSTIPGMPWSRWDYTASPVALGFSNLREFQWTEVPAETTKGDRTAWSGEIILGRWLHVAIVNDVEAATTTMYVDGAPVLRNATDTGGHSLNAGMPWLFGVDWVDDGPTNGWNGCIGETRVIDHPTGPTEWLTARPSLAGLTVDTTPDDRVPHGTTEVELAGTGTPRATVTVGGDLDGTTVVGEDGTWRVVVPLSDHGVRTWTVTQGFGTRTSDPLTGTFRIAAPDRPDGPTEQPTEEPTEEPTEQPTDGPTEEPTEPADGWFRTPFGHDDEPTMRMAGGDRVATAVELSREAFVTGVPVVVLVRADSFADAISAGPAAAHLGGPVLLAGDTLPQATADEIDRLRPASVVIVGGTSAISDTVASQVAALTEGDVVRYSGPDRFSTSAAVAEGVFDNDAAVVLATGWNFPDALGGGVLAAREGGPVLLVDDAMPGLLADRSPSRVTVLGGTSALPASLDDEIAEATGAEVVRLAGDTRFETAALVARAAFPDGSPTAMLATGGSFADALAGVPVAALSGSPLLLTEHDALPASTEAYLLEHMPQVLLLGGDSAISTSLQQALAELLAG